VRFLFLKHFSRSIRPLWQNKQKENKMTFTQPSFGENQSQTSGYSSFMSYSQSIDLSTDQNDKKKVSVESVSYAARERLEAPI
jgi:hypothetical protein